MAAWFLLGACLVAGERWTQTTRATASEPQQSVAGDDLIPSPAWAATRAVTIDAPRDRVWPWIVQMRFPKRRADRYAPSYLDGIVWRIKERSSEVLVPDLEHLATGDRVPDGRDRSACSTVIAIEPEHLLVLKSTTHLLPPVDASGWRGAGAAVDASGWRGAGAAVDA